MNFKLWLEENTNYEYWGPYSFVTKLDSMLEITADDLEEPLYIPLDADFTFIEKWPLNKKLSPPWNKYFQYIKKDDKNIVTYVENRAVDCVCYSPKYKAIYLINRNAPPKGIALPGGFFDTKEDGINPNNPQPPEKVGQLAAARELHEETQKSLNPSSLIPLGRFITGASDTREKMFRVWAYMYFVPDDEVDSFKFGDDAAQAPGSPTLNQQGLKGWYLIDNIPTLAFPHHNEIIQTAIKKIK